MNLIVNDNSIYPTSFADQISTFLAAVSSQIKSQPQGEGGLLAILSIDALIRNVYSLSRNGESFQPNSSSFYGWMSSSQMSMDQSGISEREMQQIGELMLGLSNS